MQKRLYCGVIYSILVVTLLGVVEGIWPWSFPTQQVQMLYLTLVGVSFFAGIAGEMFHEKAQENREHRKVRAVINRFLEQSTFQNRVDELLTTMALEVKKVADQQVFLQKRGLDAFLEQFAGTPEGWTYEDVEHNLKASFKGAQDTFYSTYDGAAASADVLHYRLLSRSWQEYAKAATTKAT